VAGLAAGIRELVAAGAIPAAVSGEFVERAEERGLRLRTYRLAPGESVACTAGPDDDFVVVRLGLQLAEGESVDLVAEVADLETGARDTRLTEDVPVDPGAGEIVYLYPAPPSGPSRARSGRSRPGCVVRGASVSWVRTPSTTRRGSSSRTGAEGPSTAVGPSRTASCHRAGECERCPVAPRGAQTQLTSPSSRVKAPRWS